MSAKLSPGPFRWTDDTDECFEAGVLVDANGDAVGVHAAPHQTDRYAANLRAVEASAELYDMLATYVSAPPSGLSADFKRRALALVRRIDRLDLARSAAGEAGS